MCMDHDLVTERTQMTVFRTLAAQRISVSELRFKFFSPCSGRWRAVNPVGIQKSRFQTNLPSDYPTKIFKKVSSFPTHKLLLGLIRVTQVIVFCTLTNRCPYMVFNIFFGVPEGGEALNPDIQTGIFNFVKI